MKIYKINMKEEEEEHEINSSFRRKKSSVVDNISCCFNGATQHQHHRRASLDGVSFSSPISHHRRSTSAWFKSKTNDLPEIKGRCRNFISRMGHHRRHSSADFSYDPLSYALNFDDDAPSSSSSDAMMNFSARLPLTPPGRTAKTTITPFNHHLPRSPIPDAYGDITASGEEDSARPKMAGAGNGDLRRGFEALSVSIKGVKVAAVAGQRRNNNNNNNTDQEEATSPMPVSSSSNQGILVQLC